METAWPEDQSASDAYPPFGESHPRVHTAVLVHGEKFNFTASTTSEAAAHVPSRDTWALSGLLPFRLQTELLCKVSSDWINWLVCL